jgi:hypothetical protein
MRDKEAFCLEIDGDVFCPIKKLTSFLSLVEISDLSFLSDVATFKMYCVYYDIVEGSCT